MITLRRLLLLMVLLVSSAYAQQGNFPPSSSSGGGSFNGTVTYTSSQTASTADNGKIVVMNCASACAYTLPNPQPSSTWFIQGLQSKGATVATASLGATMTYNGGASAPTIIGNFQIGPIAADSASSSNYVGGITLNPTTGLATTNQPNQVFFSAQVAGAQNASLATNFGTPVGSTAIGPTLTNIIGSFHIYIYQTLAGVACSAVSNTAQVSVQFTDPAGNAQSIAGPTLTITGNGTVGAASGTFAQQILGFASATGTSHFTVASTLTSTGCTTTPQYIAIVGQTQP